jgi:hypothetical protein
MLRQVFQDIRASYRRNRDYRKWLEAGKPIPVPDAVKQLTVRAYATRYGIRAFVETGTYGDMILATKDIFGKVYSIELSTELYEEARKKFSRYKHISILQGDSAKVLRQVLNEIDEPCLFWFDAHYSEGDTARGEKETPILEEMRWVFDHPIEDHIILIDDARLFTGRNDYPTLEELRNLVLDRYRHYIFEVEDDIIRTHKNSSLFGG